MEVFVGLLCVAIALFFLFLAFNVLIEPAYMLMFDKPVYVHWYLFTNELPTEAQSILNKEFGFYRNLTPARKKYFRHRVHAFIEYYDFVGREGLEVTDAMKIRIAATNVMLTFGMRQYLTDVFQTIIVYPDAFLSLSTQEYHKGEFNPAVGAVVFSWHHFMEGIEYDNDNLNLGLHEFAHALHFSSLRKRTVGTASVLYRDMLDKIMKYISKPANREKLAQADYFRLYAYTNQFEFIAVILEYFFETPNEFRQKLPELYDMVSKMINFKR